MNLYPLDLVLAAALAWALIFFAALPTRLFRRHVFVRLAGLCGGAWMVVALVAPPAILHYYVLLGFLCLYAWRQLRHDHAFSGKGWLTVAAGLGISLGVILILAVTPGAFPSKAFAAERLLILAAIYLGGAVIGLAAALYFFTRRESTRAGIPAGPVNGSARLLLIAALGRAVVGGANFLVNPTPEIGSAHADLFARAAWLLTVLVLPPLAWVACRRVQSPAPSTSGPVLLFLAAAALTEEILARW